MARASATAAEPASATAAEPASAMAAPSKKRWTVSAAAVPAPLACSV
jgi:hypothetical protein